jgi:hypothetical protein
MLAQAEITQDQELQEMLKEMKASHVTVPFARKLRTGLKIVGRCPTLAANIGIIQSRSGSLLVYSTFFGITIGVRPNTVNHNLNDHGFTRERPRAAANEIRKCWANLAFQAGKWSLWRHLVMPFNQNMMDSELNFVIHCGNIGRELPRIEFRQFLTATRVAPAPAETEDSTAPQATPDVEHTEEDASAQAVFDFEETGQIVWSPTTNNDFLTFQ